MNVDSRTRVVVTGASRGIRAAIADAFEARGCEVGRVSRSGEINADVADADSIGRALEEFGVRVFHGLTRASPMPCSVA